MFRVNVLIVRLLLFCEGFFLFSFTANALVHSGLRGVGEAVKAISENLLTCGDMRVYAYARIARGCARSCVIGEEDGKVGRKEKESGGEGVKRVG